MTSVSVQASSSWATPDWLSTHFWAKSANRLRQMASLPIRSGDRVLDVGCGSGVYLSYVADLVGPTGTAVGIDRLEDSVQRARDLLTARGATHATAIHTSLEEHLGDIEQYDVVLFMNALGYSADYRTIIHDVAAALEPGGRIIVKDYDLESVLLSPINRSHWVRLIEAAAEADQDANPLPFSNFFGRHLPFLAAKDAFSSNETVPWTNIMARPFSPAQRAYISGNIESLVLQARDRCPRDVLDYFAEAFATDGGCFFEQAEALFVENEYVTVLTK